MRCGSRGTLPDPVIHGYLAFGLEWQHRGYLLLDSLPGFQGELFQPCPAGIYDENYLAAVEPVKEAAAGLPGK